MSPTESQHGSSPALIYLSGLGPVSRQNLGYQLKKVVQLFGEENFETFDWSALTAQEVERQKNHWIRDGSSRETINLRLAAVRGVLRVAQRLGQYDVHEMEKVRTIQAPRGESQRTGRRLHQEDLDKLMEICLDGAPAGYRDAAMVAVMYNVGLKRRQVVDLDYPISFDETEIRVQKAEKTLTFPILKITSTLLDAWIEIRGTAKGPLFNRILKSGKVVEHSRITPEGLYFILDKRATEAGINHCSPHDLRKTFAMDLLEENDLVTVQRLMNHKDPKTTAKYIHNTFKRATSAMKALKKIPSYVPNS